MSIANTTTLTFTSGLDHAIDSNAPPISRTDMAAWKTTVMPEVAHHFVERYAELQTQYELLLTDYECNRLIYNSDIKFVPVVGHTYYLYHYHGKHMLSLIDPKQSGWHKFLGAFRLNAAHVWEKQ